ncbi:MAG: helix-turn-helix transcriptional regulator [Ekhidna sp.]
MVKIDVLTLLSILGTFQGLVFAAIFWHKKNSLSNRIFAIFLLFTSIRVGKNILVHLYILNRELFPNWEEFWLQWIFVGLSHQFAIGPLLFLYFKSKLSDGFKWHQKYVWHFVPYVGFSIASFYVTRSFWYNYGGLWASYVSILFYYLWTVRLYSLGRTDCEHGTKTWLRGLLIVIALLLIMYSPTIFRYTGYVGSGSLFTIAIFTVGVFMLRDKGKISFFHRKYQKSGLNEKKVREIRNSLEELMKEQHPYTHTELTIRDVSALITVHTHELSRVINQEFKMSFTDYINSYRLKEAASRLSNPRDNHLKISAISYESGFNSVPTFNTLFKKVHKMTPSEFRRNQS